MPHVVDISVNPKGSRPIIGKNDNVIYILSVILKIYWYFS